MLFLVVCPRCSSQWCAPSPSPQIGHPGLDYGSGFPVIGFVPQLNLSYALGANTGGNPRRNSRPSSAHGAPLGPRARFERWIVLPCCPKGRSSHGRAASAHEPHVRPAHYSRPGENPMGMNYTLGALENRELISAVYCPFLQAAVQAQLPGFPDFECGPTLW